MEIEKASNLSRFGERPFRVDHLQDILKDRITCNHYIKAIQQCPFLFKDKKILCLFSGSGFLTLLCCRAGASHVYNFDQDTDENQKITKAILKQNGYLDRVTMLRGRIQDVKMPKVDIITSMWANYTLFYGNKLESLIYARDNLLKKDGLIFPDLAKFKIAFIQDEYYYDKKIRFWEDVYKVDMSCMKQFVFAQPIVDLVDPSVIATTCQQIFTINLETIKKQNLDFVVEYNLKARQSINTHAMIGWYDLHFTLGPKQNILSTSPFSTKTRFKQTIFYLKDYLELERDDIIKGTIAIKHSSVDKTVNFKISYHHRNKNLIQYYLVD